jgi:hypothetical protein
MLTLPAPEVNEGGEGERKKECEVREETVGGCVAASSAKEQ